LATRATDEVAGRSADELDWWLQFRLRGNLCVLGIDIGAQLLRRPVAGWLTSWVGWLGGMQSASSSNDSLFCMLSLSVYSI
jgi:hypothetical protein